MRINRHYTKEELDKLPSTKLEAKISNSSVYFTKVPCHRGHSSPRYVTNGGCLDCHNLNARTTYSKMKNNPDRYKEHLEKGDNFRSNQTEHYLLVHAKHRAKKRGLDFNLDISDVVIPPFCPALNIPLVRSKEKASASSPTIDRLDNTKGYVKGNIRVISYRANTLKSNATLVEIEGLYLYMKQLLENNDNY